MRSYTICGEPQFYCGKTRKGQDVITCVLEITDSNRMSLCVGSEDDAKRYVYEGKGRVTLKDGDKSNPIVAKAIAQSKAIRNALKSRKAILLKVRESLEASLNSVDSDLKATDADIELSTKMILKRVELTNANKGE